jgi:hypothetical protein
MNALANIDSLYTHFLTAGFISLREALDVGDLEWAKAETELLHNVPSLIGERSWGRHDYFMNEERSVYIAWVSAPGRENVKARMKTFYQPFWSELEVLVKNRTERLAP